MDNQGGPLPPGETSIGDFREMLHGLACPEAFPWVCSDKEPIAILQTHASAVILTATRAYKLKKPHDFGFFDYSSPALRRYFCQQEVKLNAPLAPHIYLGIAPVIAYSGHRWRFGPTCPADQVPEPGTPSQHGNVVDYAVVMVRLPDEATLASLVQKGTATPHLLAEVAHLLATFHTRTHTDQNIANFGQIESIRANWEENFAQIVPYLGRTIDGATYDQISSYVRQFMEQRVSLFSDRVHHGHIRDCHGDLRLQHVYVLDPDPDPPSAHHHLVLLDRIEFNERFRYGDVASEVAFLAMELDAASRADLAQVFIESYRRETDDDSLCEILPFYSCYRACVRGKVASFQLDQPEVEEVQRKLAWQEAERLFRLAAHYSHAPITPQLVMIGGLMGTGKSTLARALQRKLGWGLLSSDTTRKHLAQLDPTQPQVEAFGQGIYSSAWTARTYATLCQEAANVLASGRSVLLDASFLRRTDRQSIAHEAIQHRAQVFFVECLCPRACAWQRLEQRWQQRAASNPQHVSEASFASDGRPHLYDAQHARWESFVSDEEPDVHSIPLDATRPVSTMLEHIIGELHIPHLICMISSQKDDDLLYDEQTY